MSKFLRLLLSLFFFFAVFIFSPHAFAQNTEESAKSFENSLSTTYTVQTNGTTVVQHRFRIRNLTPTYYVSRHGLRISSPNVSSVKVSQGSTELPAEVTYTDNQTNIGITFPDEVVGEGKVREFTITYVNPDLAQIQGQVLEVAIPKQAEPGQYDQISVVLNTPIAYGRPTRVTPNSDFTTAVLNQQVQLTFSDLRGQGVSALYGFQQVYSLKFTYFLHNTDSQPVLLQVALPPDTPYQRMSYQRLEPKPQNIEIDEDGNWIATFYLGGNTAQTVEAEALAALSLEPSAFVHSPGPQSFSTQAQPYWETGNASIRELAQQYTTPKEIYDFVVDHLQYATPQTIQDIKRVGAAQALETPTLAACQEFSDLFVALARANGIPARVITGYAHTQNSALRPLSLGNDILHAWPEYWDEEAGRWKAVDPTWENTTGGVDYFNQFDLNHITLAINGKSSTLPYPAGSYKTPDITEKTLHVDFATQFPPQHPDISVNIVPRRTALTDVPGFYQLTLENNTGTAWYNVSLDITADHSAIRLFGNNQFGALLPYQSITIPLFVYNTEGAWPTADQLNATVRIGEDTVAQTDAEIKNAPQLAQYLAHPYALISVGAFCVLLALSAGSLLILRRKK